MPRSSYQLIVFFCLALTMISLTAACSAQPQAGPPLTEAASPPGAPAAAAPPADTYEVVAWVDNPSPLKGERVNLSGSLIKNGVYLGGMMMHATWPDEDQERGVPNCKVLVIYQRGVCIIETNDYQAGEFVPVTIKFVYNDQSFQGQTGFTIK